MANSYLDSIEKARQFAQEHLKDWDAIDKKLLDVVDKVQKIPQVSMDSGSIKEMNKRIEEQVNARKQMNTVITEQETKIKALQSQITKLQQSEQDAAATKKKSEADVSKSIQQRIDMNNALRKQQEREQQNNFKNLAKAAREHKKLQQAQEEAFRSHERNLKIQEQAEAKIAASREKSVSKQLTGQMQEYVQSIGRTNDGLKKMNAYYRELEKSSKKAFAGSVEGGLNKKLEQSERRLLEVRSEQWKQIESNRRAANEEAQAIRNQLTTYGQYSQQLLQMSREYKDLAIQKARLNNLTDEEIKRMDALENQITQLRGQLVSVDHSVGQFGRSVGSYGKQFDSLGFSIAQITREMPAFAYGAQIGFAALSNNIPMLFDEIQKTKLEMAALRKEGKATGSVLGRLGAAIFSFQSLISVGVTLLTLYGAEMIEWGQSMIKSRNSTSAAEDALRDYNEALEESRSSTRLEIEQIKALVDVIEDENTTRKQRNDAVKLLQDEYPDLLANLTTENTKSKEVAAAINQITEAIENRAKVQAAEGLITEKYKKFLEEQVSIQEDFSERIRKAREIEDRGIDPNNYYDKHVKGQANLVETLEKQQKAAILESQQAYDAYADQLANIYKGIPNLFDVLGDSDEGGRGKEARREQIQSISELGDVVQHSVAYYEQLIASMEAGRQKVARSSEEWESYTKAIEDAQRAIQIIQDIQDYAREELAMSPDELEAFTIEVTTRLSTDGIERGMKRISEITGEGLEELYAEMHTYYGKDWESYLEFSERKLRQKEIEAAKIKEIQGEVVDAAVGLGSALFEAEIERIEQRIDANKDYYAQILAGAELTEERRAALEAERDLKERQLMKEKRKRENEQFLFEQGVALARTAMHTAVAIAEAAPNPALVAWVSILGAIQAATIIAQSIPKFATGTENAPEGWAIVDEVRPEVHTDKRGKVKSYGSEKGPNLRFLEQGDKIYRNREEYFKKVGHKEIDNTIWNLNMQKQGAPIAEVDVNNALLREIAALRGENSKMWREFRKIASRPIHNSVKVEMPDTRPY